MQRREPPVDISTGGSLLCSNCAKIVSDIGTKTGTNHKKTIHGGTFSSEIAAELFLTQGHHQLGTPSIIPKLNKDSSYITVPRLTPYQIHQIHFKQCRPLLIIMRKHYHFPRKPSNNCYTYIIGTYTHKNQIYRDFRKLAT
ncbi:hypothetical protein [Planococcus sp. ISL-109]|uniref:hypothetical protein n=1 Tax=Planococcus sp. ISL-109 TaxID=2819166 RepID=UPI001BE8D116|nr:hypothetical protein [Planococcus sp. ISL-109]MBT2581221.1 hypothetical protein [Planococcus sp. ISL-109]